jgi:hypothetical protein
MTDAASEACAHARDTAIDRAQRAAIAEPTKEVSDLDAGRRIAWLLNAAASAPVAPSEKDEPNG